MTSRRYRKLNVLVVDDSEILLDVTREALRSHFDIETSDGQDALSRICTNAYDVVLTDSNLGRYGTGEELIRAAKDELGGRAPGFVLYSGDVLCPPPGVIFLHKPVPFAALVSAIQKASKQ